MQSLILKNEKCLSQTMILSERIGFLGWEYEGEHLLVGRCLYSLLNIVVMFLFSHCLLMCIYLSL